MRGIVMRGKTYSYVFVLEPEHEGKRRQKWVGGFRTKKEAEAGLAEALGRVHAGTYSDAGRQPYVTSVNSGSRAWRRRWRRALSRTTDGSSSR